MTYSLLDSGNEQKLEQFGAIILCRPCSVAIWQPQHKKKWEEADALFSRDERWIKKKKLPSSWVCEVEKLLFKIAPTEFGHLGVFPEHSALWKTLPVQEGSNILNLFAYSGGATLACAKAGAKVCHLDASKGMVTWARENAALNKLEKAPIRWIVEDVMKFLQRELKRGSFYDGIILDPPSFGRGNKGEVFKIERDLLHLLQLCKKLLSKKPHFLLLSCHTPGFTPSVLQHLLFQVMQEGKIESGEMKIISKSSFDLPSGSFARWTP